MDPTNEIIDCNGKNHRTPMYRGVRRRRWGKWVSEIREPGKKRKIWLGSYAMPEMAARAYDVAAVSLKGKGALPNFPHLINLLPRPASLHPRDIQIAAAEAAFAFTDSSNSTTTLQNVDDSDHSASPNAVEGGDRNNKGSFISSNADEEDTHSSFTSLSRIRTESKCFDEELYQFDSPNLVISMAEAPLLTPLRLDGVSGYDNSYADGDSYTELENLGFLWKDF